MFRKTKWFAPNLTLGSYKLGLELGLLAVVSRSWLTHSWEPTIVLSYQLHVQIYHVGILGNVGHGNWQVLQIRVPNPTTTTGELVVRYLSENQTNTKQQTKTTYQHTLGLCDFKDHILFHSSMFLHMINNPVVLKELDFDKLVNLDCMHYL